MGSVFPNNCEVSAQEAAYRISSMPMKSRIVLFVNTDPLINRRAILKPAKAIATMEDDDDEGIFQSNIIARCLATFAANYTVTKKK